MCVDMDYIELRTAAQPEGISQNFIMLIDEIYTAERIEYVDGEFVGLTSEGETAKTLLVFMIKSLASKHKDVVCIIPKKTLTASELESDFLSVLTSISAVCDLKCENAHVLFPLSVAKIFKCFAKNFMKRKNAPISKHQNTDRKIRT